MRTNKYLKIEEAVELSLYKFIEDSDNKPKERKRALAILMNREKKSVIEISKKIGMNPDTVYDWLIKFTNDGIEGIKNKPIVGRPKKVRIEDMETVKEVFKKSA